MSNLKIAIATLITATGLALNDANIVFAGSEINNNNPLESNQPDPLLPKKSTARSLSPLEIYRLNRAISELETAAETALVTGEEDRAFAIWYRALKLRREIDKIAEIKALGKVGAIAWQKRRQRDLKNITQRLQTISSEINSSQDIQEEILLALGAAYQQIEAIEPTISTYKQILVIARSKQDTQTKIAALQIIGERYLAKFDRSKAAPIYEELLNLAEAEKDNYNLRKYLIKLADIYDRDRLPTKAIPIKERLQKQYLAEQESDSIIKLKISLGTDYEAIQNPEKASFNYQEAFRLAWDLQELATASITLEKLANLYLDYNRANLALEIYQQLLIVQQKAANLYGQMNTYDRIGQIYLESKNSIAAIDSFQKGQEIAKSLQHQEEYFIKRINSVREQIENSENLK